MHLTAKKFTRQWQMRAGAMTYTAGPERILKIRMGSYLAAWADELRDHQIHTVNGAGRHDGIPLLDLKGTAAGGAHSEPDRNYCSARAVW